MTPIPGLKLAPTAKTRCPDCGAEKKLTRTNDRKRGRGLRCRSCAAKRVAQEHREARNPPSLPHPPGHA